MFERRVPPTGAATNVVGPQFYIPLSRPTVTRTLLAVLLGVFVLEILYGALFYGSWTSFNMTDIRVLIDLGAKVNVLIAEGEFWRLLTATLLHSGILHLLFNLYALFALGPLLEGYVGHTRFFFIYLIAGLYGSLASYALSGPVSVGASGAIFGLIGAITVFFARYRNNFGVRGQTILQNMIIVLVLNLVIGFSSGFIDNWGHIGGLIGGALLTAGIMPRFQPPTVLRFDGPQQLEVVDRRPFEVAWTALCIILLILGVLWVTLIRFGVAI
ncbi:MAG: rhomboid family intramembrane serine protease [Caldilineaceae bacterium]|nr:rhomboid family intramembrane serine protease [Caldilineaceae bacterium]